MTKRAKGGRGEGWRRRERRRGEEETCITLGNRVIIARLLVKEVENYARHQRRIKDRIVSRRFLRRLCGDRCVKVRDTRKNGHEKLANFGEIAVHFIGCLSHKYINIRARYYS